MPVDYELSFGRLPTDQLGKMFMSTYLLLTNGPSKGIAELEDKLRAVCRILGGRPLEDRALIYDRVKDFRDGLIREERFEQVSVVMSMIKYWDRYVEMIPDGLRGVKNIKS